MALKVEQFRVYRILISAFKLMRLAATCPPSVAARVCPAIDKRSGGLLIHRW
jgi:hypothetical protein